jgi:hypothetical protein
MIIADGIEIKNIQLVFFGRFIQLGKEPPFATGIIEHFPLKALHILFEQIGKAIIRTGIGEYHQLIGRHIKQLYHRVCAFKMLHFKYACFHNLEYIMFAKYIKGAPITFQFGKLKKKFNLQLFAVLQPGIAAAYFNTLYQQGTAS